MGNHRKPLKTGAFYVFGRIESCRYAKFAFFGYFDENNLRILNKDSISQKQSVNKANFLDELGKLFRPRSLYSGKFLTRDVILSCKEHPISSDLVNKQIEPVQKIRISPADGKSVHLWGFPSIRNILRTQYALTKNQKAEPDNDSWNNTSFKQLASRNSIVEIFFQN